MKSFKIFTDNYQGLLFEEKLKFGFEEFDSRSEW